MNTPETSAAREYYSQGHILHIGEGLILNLRGRQQPEPQELTQPSPPPVHRLPLDPILEYAVADVRMLSVLSNPNADPQRRKDAIESAALSLLSTGRTRAEVAEALWSCLNGQQSVLISFLASHSDPYTQRKELRKVVEPPKSDLAVQENVA